MDLFTVLRKLFWDLFPGKQDFISREIKPYFPEIKVAYVLKLKFGSRRSNYAANGVALDRG